MDEELIFAEAIRMPAGPERAAFLEESCGRDVALRRRIDALVDAHEDVGSFLDPSGRELTAGEKLSVVEPDDASRTPAGESAQIGPYRLIRPLGEGGMGVVYMAEQEAPVRRMVALKLIRPGMDSDQVVARFEAERQVLALMDHPNIARVLDAGTSASGQPYFVMELIDGTPIARYCDDHRLTIPERLSLFMRVCMAIQHAHQKGIIHRDVKSSNVLVTVHDGVAAPRVIDFGVSKAVGPMTGPPPSFAHSGIVGTLESMSPEQAELGSLDVDTRSDVYSLGVLLYQLLTGCTPLEPRSGDDTSYSEMLRRIREVEPPRPSVRLSGSRSSLSALAGLRKVGPARLPRILRGDLDWIVMKALQKDRSLRYDSASDLARDLERYLRDEPVEACPPSASYRLRKMVRRHRVSLAAAATFASLLVIGVAASVFLAVRATRAEREAVDNLRMFQNQTAKLETQTAIKGAVSGFLAEILCVASPQFSSAREVTMRTVLDNASKAVAARFRQQPLAEAAIRHILGRAYWGLGAYEDARAHFERAHELQERLLGPKHPETMETANGLAVVYMDQGKYDQAEPILIRLLEDRDRILGGGNLDTLTTALNLARVEMARGRDDRAVRLLEQVISAGRKTIPMSPIAVWTASATLGTVYRDRGEFDRAEPLLSGAFKNLRDSLGPDNPATLEVMNDLALLYREQGNPEKAEALYTNTFEACRRRMGDRHPDTLAAMNNLALIAYDLGHFDRAGKLFTEVLEGTRANLGDRHPWTLALKGNLAMFWRARGRLDLAESLQAETVETSRTTLGDKHPDTLSSMNNLAAVLCDRQQFDRAESVQAKSLEISRRALGSGHPHTQTALNNLAVIETRRGKLDHAVALAAELAAARKRSLGPLHREFAEALCLQGRTLLDAGKPAEAEAPLREAMAIREQAYRDDWEHFYTKCQLGASLAGQTRWAEAEPLLIAAYEGMKARAGSIPAPERSALADAAQRLVRLYEQTGKPDRAAEWRARIAPSRAE